MFLNDLFLTLFMCGPENPLVKPIQLSIGIVLIVLIYIIYKLVATKYPNYRNGMRSVAISLGLLVAIFSVLLSMLSTLAC